MLSVLKQELKIHKKNIFITAIIFAAIYLCTIFSMHLSGLFESEKIQDISALWFGLSVGLGYIGAFFIALFKGSGSMNDILFKDTGYLIKTIPVSSWKLILGKMIIGLFEFIVYFALYLLFMTFIFHCGEEIALALSMDIKFNDFSKELAYTEKSTHNFIAHTFLTSKHIKKINCEFDEDCPKDIKDRLEAIIQTLNNDR